MAVGDGLHNLLRLVNGAFEEVELPDALQRQIQSMSGAVQGEHMGVPVTGRKDLSKCFMCSNGHHRKMQAQLSLPFLQKFVCALIGAGTVHDDRHNVLWSNLLHDLCQPIKSELAILLMA